MKISLRKWLVGGILIAGVGLASGIYVLVEQRTVQAAQSAFNKEASARLAAIEPVVATEQEIVWSVAGIFRAGLDIGPTDFANFVRGTLSRHNDIQSLEWAPRIAHRDREEFEQSTRRNGPPDFEISERAPSGFMTPAKERNEYFPVTFTEPWENNYAAFGFDYRAEPARRTTFERARDTGTIAASQQIPLIGDGEGVLFVAPVYNVKNSPQTLDERRNTLRGFAVGVVDIASRVENVFSAWPDSSADNDVDFYLFDTDDRSSNDLLYAARLSGSELQAIQKRTQRQALEGRHFSRTFSVGGRNWLAVARPTRADLGIGIVWSAWGTAGMVMILFLLAAAYFYSSGGRSARVAAEVRSRTRELRDSEMRTRTIVDTTLDGIISIDAAGAVETFNPAAERIFGYSAAEVIGHNVKMLMPDPYRREHDGYLNNYHTTGMAQIIGTGREVTGRRKDGTTFPMELAVSDMVLAGEPKFTGIVRDITDRKKAEHVKNEFVSTVSHELRTPLTSIKGSLGLIEGGAVGEMPARMRDMVRIAYSNCDRLVRLINDILDIEKIDAGQMTFEMAPVDLVELMRSAIAANGAYGDTYGINFVLREAPTAALVRGDTDRLMQVFTNLLSNAAKFSTAGSSVELALTAAENFRVSVTDTGTGIPEEFQDKVFDKFSQSDASDTTATTGTGLGLAICKSIIEQHGGEIGFRSTPGRGSTFYFSLPRLALTPGHDTVEAPGLPFDDESAVSPPLRLPTILHIEDDIDVCSVVESIVDGVAEVVHAHNLADARQQLQQSVFDLILLDLQLPDGNGSDLLSSNWNEQQPIPVVVFSSNEVDGSLSERVSGSLLKSKTTNDALRTTIRTAINDRPVVSQ